MTERHIIKISVDLRVAKLLVRFPCKLTFQLKTDSAQIESRNAYELRKGQCVINQTLEAEAELNYDPLNGTYEDKKVRIFVQMASANGVIPAGNVTFNPCNKQPQEKVEYTLPLEKCPDRTAQINFLQSFVLLRKTTPEVIYQSQIANRQSSKLSKMDLKYSSASNLALQTQLHRKSPHDKSNNSKYRVTSNYRENSPRNQRVKTSQTPNYPSFRQQYTEQYEQYGQSQVLHEGDVGYQKYNSRYIDPSEKAHYVKEIAKLKGEIKSLQADERWDQLIRAKEQNESLTNELEKAKERIRMNQRRERQLGIQLKQAKEQAERTKNKYLQSQSLKNEGEVIIADKQRTIKQLQIQIKRLQEKLQDLNAQLTNQQKRVDFKESSYQEQLRKMNDKYTQSQAERQKITFDYNGLLAKLEEAEKKNQAAAKEKERNYAEQKNKLNKKIDSLSQTIEKLKEQLSDRQTQLTDNIMQVKTLTKREAEREERLASLESELQLTKMQLKKQLDQRKLYQQEITAYKAIEEERNSLKKKSNEQANQQAKTSQKLQRTISELNLLQNKAKDLEVALAERTKEKDNLNSKFNSLKKQFDALSKEQQKLLRQNQSLSAQNFNSAQKLNDFKSKLETEKNDTEQMKAFYEEQLAYMTKSKEYSDNQIEELKWAVQKAEQQCAEINLRLKNANNQILNLNETILVSNEKAKRSEEQNKQLSSLVEILRKQITDLQQKQRTLNEQLKQKLDNIYQLTKKFQSTEGQLFIAQQRMRQLEATSQDRRSSDQKSLRQRQKQLSQKGEEITSLQLEVMSLKEQLASSTQEASIKGNQISYLKESVQSLKQDLTAKDIKLEEFREQLKVSHQLTQNLTRQTETLTKGLEEEKKSASKIKKQWDEYLNATTKALQQLLQQISKDEDGSSMGKHNLLTFPDQTLSTIQAEAIKKRNALITKYQLKILEANEQKVVLQGQVKKNQQLLSEKEQQSEAVLKSQKDKMKHMTTQYQFQRQQLNKKVEELQEKNLELTGQIEKLTNQINKRDEVIEQQKEQIKIILEEVQTLRNDLKLAEEKVLGLKSNQIKWKANNQSKITEISEQNQAVIERYKLNIHQLEKKIISEDKSAKQKDQIIKRHEAKISQLTYEKEKSDIKAVQLNEKLILSGQEKKQLEKRVKQLEKELKQASQNLTFTKESLANEKAKFEEVQSKLSEAHSNLTQTQVDGEKLRAQLESARHTIAELQQLLKDKGEKAKVYGQKTSSEVKGLKETIITLTSTVELKQFQVTQLENQIASLKDSLSEAKEELARKKTENIKLADKVQEHKNQEMYNSQNIQILKSEKEFLEEENDRLKERITGLEEDIAQAQVLVEAAGLKEKELNKLKQDYETLKLERDRAANQLRTSLCSPKASNIASSRIGVSDDRKRIRELQQLLEAKHVDLSIQRKKLLNEFQREKRILVNQNSELRQEVQNLQGEFDFQRAQLNKEIESLAQEVEMLTKELNDKTEALAAQQQLLETIKTQQNAGQIEECLANIKAIFNKSDGLRDERSVPFESEQVENEDEAVQE